MYALQDFLMFSPEVYLRLFLRLHQQAWPWTLLALCGLALPWLLTRSGVAARRLAVLLMALAMCVAALGFLHTYYQPINWPVGYAVVAFLGQGAVLALLSLGPRLPRRQRPGWPVAAFATMLLLPWLVVAATGQWQGPAVYGLTPDLTAAVTILCTAGWSRPWRWLLIPVPALWSLFSLLTLYALGLYALMVTPLIAILAALWLLAWEHPSGT